MTTTRTPIWAGIVRVSHVGSRNGDAFHADEEQVADVKRYAKAHGGKVVFMEPELSVSGGAPIEQRPALMRAIEGCEAGEFDGILVSYLSRLTRSRSGIEIWERVEAAGGRVLCASENLDTSTPSGRFVRDIHLANAVREREEHVVRNADRRRQTVEERIWRQRQVPLGYRFKGPAVDGRFKHAARRLVPSEDAPKVRRAFRDKAAGVPLVRIADRLGMTPNGVRQLLRNRVYLGELHDGDNVNPRAYKPIVTVAEFEAAQLDSARPARSGGEPALLAGLVRCASCGHIMRRSGGTFHSYRCHGRHSGVRCPAPAAIACDALDEHVMGVALRQLRRLRVSEREGAAADQAQQKLRDAELELKTYLEAVSAVDVGAEAFAAGASKRRDDVEAARGELRRAKAVEPVLPAGAVLTTAERNRVLRGLLSFIAVAPVGRGRKVPVAERVRVVAAGVEEPVRRNGAAAGIVPLALDGEDAPGVALT
jgi:DNA invertase Pin-like site-specific DNA recombinase